VNTHSSLHPGRARGMVLITALLLLIVVTVLALAMFRGVGLEARIAGNVMDKQRALNAAISAQQYAEEWLVSNAAATPDAAISSWVDCSSQPFTAGTPMICLNALSSLTSDGTVTTVPWSSANGTLGTSYNPGGDITQSATGGPNTYYGLPVYYVAFSGTDKAVGRSGFDYTIDSWSYAGSSSTVAEVESTYRIRYKVRGF
jgi:type IV pilus assembly protein PilX